ncbi:unnamed protein product [Paramecium sonneborni]|uniref:Uncharacterized protein n=1 Tax=Paramecium sonneborni TaxID=65129 RepID=A0A8S1JXA9_9CILI|nr:unnamed protein product [Paramecium sonneborni]
MNYLFGGKDLKQQQGRSDQPPAINIHVVINLQKANLNLELTIDSEIPFDLFLTGIKEQIFAQRMQDEDEETIEWQLGNGSNLQQNDQRSLKQLGFTNNCTLYGTLKLKGSREPTINIICSYQQLKIKMKLPFAPYIPFVEFLNEILLKQIFENETPREFKNNIECKLEQIKIIKLNETSSLENLGFSKNCTLYINLNNREYQKQILQQKMILNVLVDLQFQKIELNVSQYKSTPISCVFHDILMELFSKLQFKVTQPFAFFINEKEIDPYDCRLLEDFEQIQSINLEMIPSNKQSNQLLNEKYQFALKNKSKWYKFKLENIIKIQCIENNVTVRAFINTSLEDITKQIISELQISKIYQDYSLKYYINGEEFQEITSIYSKTDIKAIIKYQKQQNVNNSQFIFQYIGDFYQKMIIWGQINSNNFLIEESIELNDLHKELLDYVKFKMFGIKQEQYSQKILEQENGFIKVNYIQKKL